MRWKNKYLCLFVIILCAACSKNEVVYDIGAYKVDLATVQTGNNKQAFLLDDNTLLLNGGAPKEVEPGKRVLINYSCLEETSPGYDYVIKINGISLIAQSQLSEVNPVTIDTIANKPIHLESVWIGSRYLNISFYMNYHSKKHAIYLITDKTKINDEEITVYFRHNDGNDPLGSLNKVIASFDLSNVLGNPVRNKPLTVNINSDNYGEKDYKLVY